MTRDVCKPDGRWVRVPADYTPPTGYVLVPGYKGGAREALLTDIPATFTRVEGLPVLARFVGDTAHVIRRATEAEARHGRMNGNYRDMPADAAAHRAAWDRVAKMDAGR